MADYHRALYRLRQNIFNNITNLKVKSKVSEDAFKDIEEIVEFLNRPIPCCRYCLPNQEEKIPWGVSKRDISEWF